MEIPIKYRRRDVRRSQPTSGLRTLTAKTFFRADCEVAALADQVDQLVVPNAWLGMRDVELPKGVALIGAPHSSNLAVNSDKLAEGKIERAWCRAKQLIEPANNMAIV